MFILCLDLKLFIFKQIVWAFIVQGQSKSEFFAVSDQRGAGGIKWTGRLQTGGDQEWRPSG